MFELAIWNCRLIQQILMNVHISNMSTENLFQAHCTVTACGKQEFNRILKIWNGCRLHHAFQMATEHPTPRNFLPLWLGLFSHMTRRKKAIFTTRLNGPWDCSTFFNTPNPLWATNCCSAAFKLQSRTTPVKTHQKKTPQIATKIYLREKFHSA